MSNSVLRWTIVGALSFGGISGPGAAAISGTPTPVGFAFTQYEVVIGPAQRQTVMTGFFLGGSVADLVVIRIDENQNRHLRIYAFNGTEWMPALEATLRPEVSLVDVANIRGRDRLISYEPGRVNWFDPESGTEQSLVSVTSNFTPPRSDEIPHVQFSLDLNNDGRDDLVAPVVDGFSVFIQNSDGSFEEPMKVGPPPDMAGIYGADGYRYAPWPESRIHETDYNQDGRNDLVFWSRDHFEVHVQDEHRRFARSAATFTTKIKFDSDKIYSLTTGDMRGRVLHSLGDLNGDAVADLVVFALEGASTSSKRSTFEVHFGKPTPQGGTAFEPGVDMTFRSDDRIQLAMDRQDFDRDGQGDVMVTTIAVAKLQKSLWKRIKGSMGDDIHLHLEFYRAKGGRFSEEPDTTRKIALDGPPSHREPGWVPLEVALYGATHESRKTRKTWPRAFNSTLLIGDVTGDGLLDLIIGSHPRQLEVFVGEQGTGLFSRQSQSVAIAVPNDGEYTWLVDLNRDGKQDILMHHPFTLRDAHGARKKPPGSEPHRVTLLIAR